jgi:hypothetical protein
MSSKSKCKYCNTIVLDEEIFHELTCPLNEVSTDNRDKPKTKEANDAN